MKFAVLEYTSKSGKIWKHTSQKPNYLADPDKEIDPTSFGCYVSAFEGEHIPLKELILDVATPLQLARRMYRKFTRHWPENYDISYLTQFDVLLVVHQISDGHEITSLVKRLNKRSHRPYIIGVPTQPFGLLQQYWNTHPDWLADFQQFMNACDVFLTIVKSTLPTWQQMTSTPVVYAPQPYPVEHATSFFQPQASKNATLFVAGVTDRPNIALGFKVAAALQRKHPEYMIHVTTTPGHTQDFSNLTGSTFKAQSFLPWQEQLQYLSRVKLVINTDYTATRGRVQTDCAAVGTPSIGADSDAQHDLYPDFHADAQTPFESLVEQGEGLLTNQALYEKTVITAAEGLKKYTYKNTKQNLIDIMNTYPKRV